jgi:hypothetical protein
MEPAELVDLLLERRAALPAVTAAIELKAEDLTSFFAERPAGHYDHAAGFDAAERDLDALVKLTSLPRTACSALLERTDLPPEERAAFVLAYRPPSSPEGVWETARAFGRYLAGERSVRGAVALDVLRHETYGLDIQSCYDKLMSHYQSEKTNHDRPSQQAENRLATYEKTVKVEWRDLPF